MSATPAHTTGTTVQDRADKKRKGKESQEEQEGAQVWRPASWETAVDMTRRTGSTVEQGVSGEAADEIGCVEAADSRRMVGVCKTRKVA
ncbi:MAG: hypothetical protein R2693_03245 [Nocardioidaceae bacterium]